VLDFEVPERTPTRAGGEEFAGISGAKSSGNTSSYAPHIPEEIEGDRFSAFHPNKDWRARNCGNFLALIINRNKSS
jgi:hypothetical protein